MKTTLKKISLFLLIFLQSTLVFAASKNPVRGEHGMVVTSHELASRVGIEILKQGGNAVDAAVAVGYALAVVFPTAGNLGGGGFMVISFPDGRNTTIDYREKAPSSATRDMFLDENGDIIRNLSIQGYLASGVPGSVAGLTLALEKYGTMPRKKVIAPAIQLAKQGFPVSYEFAKDLQRLAPVFRKYPGSAKTFLKKHGEPYTEGEIFKQPVLARTLKLISKKGAAAFYDGEIAEIIASEMAKNGGLVTTDDLAAYIPVERPPVVGTYRDYEIISMGLPSSGGIALIQSLNILEHFDLQQLGYNSSDYIHLLAEMLKQVYCDRAIHLGDGDYVDVPVNDLIHKEYAQKIANRLNLQQATPSDQINAGSFPPAEGDHTTHYSVIDKNQLTVAVTTTINSGYGSKVVIEGAGFLMNNEMDDIAIKPGKPNFYGLVSYDVNAIEPGKRMLSSMTPTIVKKGDHVFMTVGAMGGARIITSVLQIVLNVIDFNMTVQEAVDAPRVHHQWLPDILRLEKFAAPKDVKDRLQQLGHELQESNSYSDEVHAILYDLQQKIYLGAADSRFEGNAMGY